tara:strand:+ start:259 stop:393 length:135 start_codon:yes stop_codon:yes gene_type:complete
MVKRAKIHSTSRGWEKSLKKSAKAKERQQEKRRIVREIKEAKNG